MKKKISRLAATLLVMVLMASVFTGCDKNTSPHENGAATSQGAGSAYESRDIKVAALKGPTAIGMVKLMNDNEEKKTANNYTFQIEAAADAFTAGLIKGEVQIAAMPCNAAATLYNKSQGKISVVGINTLGVLYILDNKGEVKSVSDLKGKTIYTTGKGTTPEYTLRYLLSSNGIDPDKDVTIEFKSEAAEVAAIMASAKEETIAMLPQPFATTVLMKNQDVRIALDVTQEWEKTAKDGSSVVTGVIVVNTEYYNNNKAAVDKFLEEYRNSVDYVNANVDEASELVEKYDILAFNKNLAEDTVNPLAFELVNACLNDTDRIKTLYQNLYALDVNAFETALYKSIEFVRDSILVITKFKGNSRNANKIFPSKYQILSMISTTFKEMYAGVDFTQFSDTWQERRQKIARNLVQYYVYDIITNYWSEGGTGKIHSAAKPNRYMIEIPSRAWMVALDGFFERSMLRAEKKNIANPRSEEYVILNCIYLKTFTAMDQLSIDRFDVEHIAPKEQMRKLIEACDGDGLPISCIANLCYLPEYVNRSKGAKNFYQDKKYLQHIDLSEVESKYSFTESDDLEWMDMPYEKPEDFAVLREYYTDYCAKRFDKLKHLLCDSLEIKYEEIEPQETEVVQKVVVAKKSDDKPSKQVRFADKCIVRLAKVLNTDLVKVGRSSYRSTDGKRGYVITTSKMYTQGKREKYWFAYRTSPFDELSDCEEKYVVYGCKDENTLVVLPVPVIEEQLDRVNVSYDEDENISHWHMVFFRDTAGKMTWMLSRPNIEEIEINSFLV